MNVSYTYENRLKALFRALRGPVLLVTLGSLFAISHSGGPSFLKTWPALLIVYGIMRLLETLSDKQPQKEQKTTLS